LQPAGQCRRVANPARAAVRFLLGKALTGGIRTAFAGGGASKSYRYNVHGLKKRFKTGRSFKGDISEQAVRSGQVQVQIPVSGKRYRFASYLIKGFTPVITFYYINEPIRQIVSGIFGLCALILTCWLLGWIFERSGMPPVFRSFPVCLAGLAAAGILAGSVMFFKFGVIAGLANAVSLGIIGFAIYQN